MNVATSQDRASIAVTVLSLRMAGVAISDETCRLFLPAYAPTYADSIIAHEYLVRLIMADLPTALRSNGMVGLEAALERATSALKSLRAIKANGGQL